MFSFLKKLFGGSSIKKQPPLKEKPIGFVTHYFGHLSVAIISFKAPVKVGDGVRFYGATTDFSQVISSMQYDHKEITSAPVGKEIGVKVKNKVREGDAVYSAK